MKNKNFGTEVLTMQLPGNLLNTLFGTKWYSLNKYWSATKNILLSKQKINVNNID